MPTGDRDPSTTEPRMPIPNRAISAGTLSAAALLVITIGVVLDKASTRIGWLLVKRAEAGRTQAQLDSDEVPQAAYAKAYVDLVRQQHQADTKLRLRSVRPPWKEG